MFIFNKYSKIAFTLIETISVLIMLSVLSAVAVSKFSSAEAIETFVEMDKVLSHVRYAQIQALSSGQVWGINFTGSTYSLYRDGNTANTVWAPGTGSIPVNMNSDLSYYGIISFDEWGRAYSNENATTILSGSIDMGKCSFNIIHETGYIQ